MLSNTTILSSHIQINGVDSVKAVTFEKALEKANMTQEEYIRVLDTLDGATQQIEEEEEHDAVDAIAQSLLEAKKLAGIIEGYKSMGNLNLNLANESLHLENEMDEEFVNGSMEETKGKKYA